jgi:DNA-binding CsgD family transcriptional regulator
MANEQLVLLFFFLILSGSLVSSAVFAAYFRKQKNPDYPVFLLFFSVLTVKILINFVLLYFKINMGFETTQSLILFTLSRDLSYLIVFAFPFLFLDRLSGSLVQVGKIAAWVLAGSAVVLKALPYGLKVFIPNDFFYYSVYPVFDILLILTVLYCLFLFLTGWRKSGSADSKRLLILMIFFVLMTTADSSIVSWWFYLNPAGSGPYWLNLAFYLIWLTVLLFYVLRYYRQPVENSIAAEFSETFLKGIGLTPRECEIVKLILLGKSNSEIAEKYFISPKTVKTHITNIYQKAGVKNRIELAVLIKNRGEIRP